MGGSERSPTPPSNFVQTCSSCSFCSFCSSPPSASGGRPARESGRPRPRFVKTCSSFSFCSFCSSAHAPPPRRVGVRAVIITTLPVSSLLSFLKFVKRYRERGMGAGERGDDDEVMARGPTRRSATESRIGMRWWRRRWESRRGVMARNGDDGTCESVVGDMRVEPTLFTNVSTRGTPPSTLGGDGGDVTARSGRFFLRYTCSTPAHTPTAARAQLTTKQ